MSLSDTRNAPSNILHQSTFVLVVHGYGIPESHPDTHYERWADRAIAIVRDFYQQHPTEHMTICLVGGRTSALHDASEAGILQAYLHGALMKELKLPSMLPKIVQIDSSTILEEGIEELQSLGLGVDQQICVLVAWEKRHTYVRAYHNTWPHAFFEIQVFDRSQGTKQLMIDDLMNRTSLGLSILPGWLFFKKYLRNVNARLSRL